MPRSPEAKKRRNALKKQLKRTQAKITGSMSMLQKDVSKIVMEYFEPFPEVKYDEKIPHREHTPFEKTCDLEHAKPLDATYFGYAIKPKCFDVSPEITEFMFTRAINSFIPVFGKSWRNEKIVTFGCLGKEYVACFQANNDRQKNGEVVLIFYRHGVEPIVEYSCRRRGYNDEYKKGYFSWNRNTELERAMFVILDCI